MKDKIILKRTDVELILRKVVESKFKNITQVYSVKMVPEEGTYHFEITVEKTVEQKRTTVVKTATNLLKEPPFRVHDTVRLKGITQKGKDTIRRYGEWWKIAPFATETKWYIRSIKPTLQGKFAGTEKKNWQIEFEMPKVANSDRDFQVIDVCVFPTEFNWRNYRA